MQSWQEADGQKEGNGRKFVNSLHGFLSQNFALWQQMMALQFLVLVESSFSPPWLSVTAALIRHHSFFSLETLHYTRGTESYPNRAGFDPFTSLFPHVPKHWQKTGVQLLFKKVREYTYIWDLFFFGSLQFLSQSSVLQSGSNAAFQSQLHFNGWIRHQAYLVCMLRSFSYNQPLRCPTSDSQICFHQNIQGRKYSRRCLWFPLKTPQCWISP